MKKFRRENVTKNQILRSKFINSFAKDGFINEDLFNTKDRDITNKYFEMLCNKKTMGIYNSIMIAKKEIPYSETVLQTEEVGNLSIKDPRKSTTVETFALTKPILCKMYKCVFVSSPMAFGKKLKDNQLRLDIDREITQLERLKNSNSPEVKRAIKKLKAKRKTIVSKYVIEKPKSRVEILNTLSQLDDLELNGYEIVESTKDFLKDQLVKQSTTILSKDKTKDLFYRSSKTREIIERVVIIPDLINNSYYESGTNKRYPYLSESFCGHRTLKNQIKFHIKEKTHRNNEITLAHSYLTIAKPKDFDEEIFIVKQYSDAHYNPFMFLEESEVNSLMHKLRNSTLVKNDVLVLVESTFKHYLQGLEEREQTLGNVIPTITVESSSNKDLLIPPPTDFQELEENGIELDADYEGEREIDMDEVRTTSNSKGLSALDDNLVYQLIMGYNKTKVFGYYEHLLEYHLRLFINDSKNNSNTNRNKPLPLEYRDIPRPLRLIATINQNPLLFMSYDCSNPLDVFARIMYQKYLYFNPPKEGQTPKKVFPNEIFLDYKTEWGLIDSYTVKSETSCGIVSNVLPFKHLRDRFNFSDIDKRGE